MFTLGQSGAGGQLTTLGAKIDLWWARDDTLSAPDLKDFVAKGLVDKAMAEKHEAVEMWMKIEELSRQIAFADAGTRDFVVTSCTYGRIKYAIIEQAWTILFLGRAGDAAGSYDKPKLAGAIAAYDQLWDEWKKLKASDAACSTLPKDRARGDKPGIGAAVDKYRARGDGWEINHQQLPHLNRNFWPNPGGMRESNCGEPAGVARRLRVRRRAGLQRVNRPESNQ